MTHPPAFERLVFSSALILVAAFFFGAVAVDAASERRAHSAGPTSPTMPRSLTIEDRVVAQRAIEEVYWRERIWPQQNPQAKPSLDAVMPDSAIRGGVEDYIAKSNALLLPATPGPRRARERAYPRPGPNTRACGPEAR